MSNTLATWGKRKSASNLRTRTVLTLFSARDALACHQARLVLAAKGVAFDLVLTDPSKPPEDLVELNPYRSVPTLIDRDLVLYDVDVIAEYLDERYPHPPLMPVDPLSRARIRLGIARIRRDWYPHAAAILSGNKAGVDGARKRMRELLVASVPVFKAAKFFLNTELSLADCALAPLIWRLPSLGVALPREGQPIVDYGERIFRNPGYTRSMTDEEKALRAA